MTEELQNHAIRLLQEMRAEHATFQREVRERFESLEICQAALSADINEVKADGKLLRETVDLIEHDISSIKKRLKRIEKHVGLLTV